MQARSIRRLALAAAAGVAAAMACDALLQAGVGAVRADSLRSSIRWLVSRAEDRVVWLIAALLVWLLAPILPTSSERDPPDDASISRAAALQTIGLGLIVGPIVWVGATWIALAFEITLGGRWASDGHLFAGSGLYSRALEQHVPWVLAGSALMAWSRHVDSAG